NLDAKNCIAYYQTDVPPLLEHYVFYFKDAKTANKALDKLGKYDVGMPGTIIDSANCMVAQGVLLEDGRGYVYIIGKSPEKNWLSLTGEYLNDVFQQIKAGDGYEQVDITEPFTLAREYELSDDSTINYLLPVIKLQQGEMNYRYTVPSTHLYLQALGTYQSRITNLEPELEQTLQEWRVINRYWDSQPDIKYLATDEKTLDFLLQQSKERQIVMINENHFSPDNRLLVMLLLDDWYKQGFRYLALEMLWDKNINGRGFAASHSGFYTKEPMASKLIKEASNRGFKVFGYDDFSKDRERNQAKNIYDCTFKVDTLAKVIVLAGFEHISERASAGGRTWMAAEFKQTYHIDPLTIDQVEYKTDKRYNLAVIDTVSAPKKRRIQADIYVSNNLNYETFARLNHYVDYIIELPDTVINRMNKLVQSDYIISIYNAADYRADSTAIPIYNFMIKKPAPGKITIPLQKGSYLFLLKNTYNELIFSGTMD
ncbi:MAG: hypothetical protein LBT49_02070, partial [Prevotellaceae bacterium]|nr:hypothetical protein [Prevotellaceae bacterium]